MLYSAQVHDVSGSSRTKPDGKPDRRFLLCSRPARKGLKRAIDSLLFDQDLLNPGYSCLCSRMTVLFVRLGSCFALCHNVACSRLVTSARCH